MEKETQTFTVLVVEHNSKHAQLIEAAIQPDQTDSVERQVVVLSDGEQALSYLQRKTVPRPNLIILNLNLPQRDGREVLVEIKSNPNWRRIPIVILSDSADPSDIYQSYNAYGNSYVIKASDEAQLLQTIQKIETFWLGIVTLPLE